MLVIEDEAAIAMLIEDMLAELGHEVAAATTTLKDAIAITATGTFDYAIVDVNLGGQLSYAVAEQLAARCIPFAFVTGYGRMGVDTKFAKVPVLAKPFTLSELRMLLESATG